MKALLFMPFLGTALMVSIVFAQTPSEHDTHVEDHIEELMRAREEQNAFFKQREEDIRNGVPVEAEGGVCKYISSISSPPPLKTVALTFDDGPATDLTVEVLDLLKKHKIKATFFQLGARASDKLAIVKRAHDEGHLIASHSWSHPNFHNLAEIEQHNQISEADHVLGPYFRLPKLFRYPYGNATCAANEMAKKMKYDGIVGWHVDTCDWAFAKTGTVTEKQAQICGVDSRNISDLVGHVLNEVQKHNGGIVLMHDVHVRTAASLEQIILGLKKEGYKFTNLDDPRMARYFK